MALATPISPSKSEPSCLWLLVWSPFSVSSPTHPSCSSFNQSQTWLIYCTGEDLPAHPPAWSSSWLVAFLFFLWCSRWPATPFVMTRDGLRYAGLRWFLCLLSSCLPYLPSLVFLSFVCLIFSIYLYLPIFISSLHTFVLLSVLYLFLVFFSSFFILFIHSFTHACTYQLNPTQPNPAQPNLTLPKPYPLHNTLHWLRSQTGPQPYLPSLTRPSLSLLPHVTQTQVTGRGVLYNGHKPKQMTRHTWHNTFTNSNQRAGVIFSPSHLSCFFFTPSFFFSGLPFPQCTRRACFSSSGVVYSFPFDCLAGESSY